MIMCARMCVCESEREERENRVFVMTHPLGSYQIDLSLIYIDEELEYLTIILDIISLISSLLNIHTQCMYTKSLLLLPVMWL